MADLVYLSGKSKDSLTILAVASWSSDTYLVSDYKAIVRVLVFNKSTLIPGERFYITALVK